MVIFVNILGWGGTVCVLLAYYLVSTKRVTGQSRKFQVLNLCGAIGLIVNGIYYFALPSVGLNVAWLAIAIIGLVQWKQSLHAT